MPRTLTPHATHDMSRWRSDMITLIDTPRFGRIRKCKKCGYEQAETAAGADWDSELGQPCGGD